MPALVKFGLSATASPDDVKAAWRRLAAIHHPDKGGDAAVFSRLRGLYLAALQESMDVKLCESCDGSGKVVQRRGFNSVTLSCHRCGGSGVL